MYAVRDIERPEATALTNYYRTREEAETAVADRTRTVRTDDNGRATMPGREYLEIVEVDRASRPCSICGQEVQAPDPTCDFCRSCHYTGRALSRDRSEQLARFRDLLPEAADISVWHTGGGCFSLGFTFEDLPEQSYMAGDGNAGLPETDTGGWGYVSWNDDSDEFASTEHGYRVVAQAAETSEEWDRYYEDASLGLSDEAVADAIRQDHERQVQALTIPKRSYDCVHSYTGETLATHEATCPVDALARYSIETGFADPRETAYDLRADDGYGGREGDPFYWHEGHLGMTYMNYAVHAVLVEDRP